MSTVTEFVLAHLPAAPARVLEVGCGDGELARSLHAAGYDVTAIDPVAPDGPIFRRIKLEDLEDDARFDAVVGSRSFHHMGENLDLNLAHVARVLDRGPFILDEFGYEEFDETTADWYEGQRRALLAAGHEPSGPSAAEWREHHEAHHVTPSDELLELVRRRFSELHFERVPYLHRYLGGVATAELEATLVGAGAIRPIGVRFVGIRAAAPAL